MASKTETEYRLDEFVRITLDSNGSGSVLNVGPKLPGERWEVQIFSASGTANAKLQIMRGNSFDSSRQLDITNSAVGDTSDANLKLLSNEAISFWWTNGTAGAAMTCSIQGSRFVPGQRAY